MDEMRQRMDRADMELEIQETIQVCHSLLFPPSSPTPSVALHYLAAEKTHSEN